MQLSTGICLPAFSMMDREVASLVPETAARLGRLRRPVLRVAMYSRSTKCPITRMSYTQAQIPAYIAPLIAAPPGHLQESKSQSQRKNLLPNQSVLAQQARVHHPRLADMKQ